jgi:hypothetical protein
MANGMTYHTGSGGSGTYTAGGLTLGTVQSDNGTTITITNGTGYVFSTGTNCWIIAKTGCTFSFGSNGSTHHSVITFGDLT